MAKTYTVVKDGMELKELKTLPAAKKLADAEDAEVVCDGKVIYSPKPTADEDAAPAEDVEVAPVVEEPTEAPADETTVEEAIKPKTYILTAKMNIRKEPSLKAPKLGIAVPGTVVEAVLEDDWLHLTDGTFILYAGGNFAKEN